VEPKYKSTFKKVEPISTFKKVEPKSTFKKVEPKYKSTFKV
jgi:hypothetical protein